MLNDLYTKLWALLHIVKNPDNKPRVILYFAYYPPLSGKLTFRIFSG